MLQTAKNLEHLCKQKGITVSRQSFYGDPADALASLRRNDARIIVGLFYELEARRVFCQVQIIKSTSETLFYLQVYKTGLYGRRYVWFLIGWYSDTWYKPVPGENLDCTEEQVIQFTIVGSLEKYLLFI